MTQTVYQQAGNPFASYNPQPIVQGGAAMGQAYASIGNSIAAAMEKRREKKEKKEKEEALATRFIQRAEANPEVLKSLGVPNDPDAIREAANAYAKHPEAMALEMNLSHLEQRKQQMRHQEELHPSTLSGAKTAAELGGLNLSATKQTLPGDIAAKLTQQEVEQAKLNAQGGAPGVAQKQLEEESRAAELQKANLEMTTMKLKEAKEAVNIRNMASEIAFNEEGSPLGLEAVPRNLQGRVLQAAEDRKAKTDSYERAKEEFEVNKTSKLAEATYKMALIQNGGMMDKTAYERALDELNLPEDEERKYKLAWVATQSGLNQRVKIKDQISIFGDRKVSAGITVADIAGLIESAKTGGEINGKPVKIKNGVLEAYGKEGRKVKIPITPDIQKSVDLYNDTYDKYQALSGTGVETLSGSESKDLSEEDVESAVDSAFQGIKF